MEEGWERSMHGKLEGGVSEKQKHFDPKVDANDPLQKREEKWKKPKWHDVATMRYGMGMSTRIA